MSEPSSSNESDLKESPSNESDIQESLSNDIGNHSWEFNAYRIAKMLSAVDEGPPEVLVDSAHEALEKKVSPVWPTVDAERAWYSPLAAFLNNCVDACHRVLDEHPRSVKRSSRVYDRLKFIVYDKPMLDEVEGASPVQPNLVGGLDLEFHEHVAWSPKSTFIKQALMPVDVEEDWVFIVTQAATHARCLFSASPPRRFSVVLGFQHTSAELRFLVFYRSGLTGSKACSVKDPQGQKDILRIFLSILQWTSANDAGFFEFFDDFEMSLLRHKSDETGVVANVTKVLHDGLCVRGRAPRVLLMDYSTSEGNESCNPPLIPNIRTCGPPEGGAHTEQVTKQGDGETRMSSHP